MIHIIGAELLSPQEGTCVDDHPRFFLLCLTGIIAGLKNCFFFSHAFPHTHLRHPSLGGFMFKTPNPNLRSSLVDALRSIYQYLVHCFFCIS